MASVAILSGGRARRFGGRDKGAMLVEGRTILERQLEQAASFSDDVMVIGPVAPGPARPRGPRHVTDRWANCGPLGGLEAALASARDPEVAVIACDMPFVEARLLDLLVASLGHADAVVPFTERGYHPLCAVYARHCHGVVLDSLAHGDLKMMHLLDALRVRPLTRDDMDRIGSPDRLLANVNTPAAFDELESLLGHKL
jgi:molybdopterin-guanine dinucleotide biosynthesis protein A